MYFNLLRLYFCVCSLFFGHCVAGTVALEKEISQIASRKNIGALVYGVVSKSDIIAAKALGSYSRLDTRAINLDSIFRVGSISKTFTALLTLQLDNQGKLNINVPVYHYLEEPPFTNRWSSSHPITAAQLLEHTSGLRDMSRKEFDQLLPMNLTRAFEVDPDSRITAWPPGLHSSYSNSGAGIVSAILESVSGETFSNLMKLNIFTPLGLTSASFEPPKDMTQFVQGYDADGVTAIPYWHQLYPAFGALNISSRDMLRFTQVLMNDGSFLTKQLLARGIVRQMSKPSTTLAAKAGLAYGYGKGLYHFQHHGHTFFGHGGDADGYLAFVAFSISLNRGYFIVINSYQPDTLKELRNIIQDFITDDIPPTRPAVITMNEDDTKLLLGGYQEVTKRFVSEAPPRTLRISTDGTGNYFTRVGEGAAKQLLPVTHRFFRRPWQSTATIALIQHDGQIYLQGDFGNFIKLTPQD